MNVSNRSRSPCLMIGAGGHAKVLIDTCNLIGIDVVGLITPDLRVGTSVMGMEVIGDDEIISSFGSSEVSLINGIGVLPNQNRRQKIGDDLREKGFKFKEIIHPTAIVSSHVTLAEGVNIMAGVIIQTGCHIGTDSIINTGSTIDHDCTVGDFCHIAPGVTLCGGISIGSGVYIGTGASIIQGIKIGNGSIIGAGVTVVKDVEEYTIVKPESRITTNESLI